MTIWWYIDNSGDDDHDDDGSGGSGGDGDGDEDEDEDGDGDNGDGHSDWQGRGADDKEEVKLWKNIRKGGSDHEQNKDHKTIIVVNNEGADI